LFNSINYIITIGYTYIKKKEIKPDARMAFIHCHSRI